MILTVVFAYLLCVAVLVIAYISMQLKLAEKRDLDGRESNESLREELAARTIELTRSHDCLLLMWRANAELRAGFRRWKRVTVEIERIAKREARECGEKEARLRVYDEIIEFLHSEARNLAAQLLAERKSQRRAKALEEFLARIADACGRLRRV